MAEKRYCNKCREWVEVDESERCPKCGSQTYLTRSITDPEEVRKYVKVREEFKERESKIIDMIADSGALMEEAPLFTEKERLIEEILNRIKPIPKNAPQDVQDAIDMERQVLVLRAGWNNMSTEELKKIMEG